MEDIVKFENFSVFVKNKTILDNINLTIKEKKVNTILGPSGSGKTTILKAMNRIIEMYPEYKLTGKIYLNGKDIMDYDVFEIRRRIGMVFQQPVPFPLSIYENVAFGPRIHMKIKRKDLDEIVIKALKQADLYDEVKDDLNRSALKLSGGQQQRLCIARALAVSPEILMMDEPTTSLDPISSRKIEDLIVSLRENYTIVLVTHDVRLAARISDIVTFIYNGKILETGSTREIFENPKNEITEMFITKGIG